MNVISQSSIDTRGKVRTRHTQQGGSQGTAAGTPAGYWFPQFGDPMWRCVSPRRGARPPDAPAMASQSTCVYLRFHFQRFERVSCVEPPTVIGPGRWLCDRCSLVPSTLLAPPLASHNTATAAVRQTGLGQVVVMPTHAASSL